MKILGLDVGDKKIGVAVSDELEIISTPLEVIKNDKNAAGELKKIIDKYKVKKIVVGMPYTLKGEVGGQAKKVIDFVEEIIKKFGTEIDYIDERYTTKIPLRNPGRYPGNKEIDKFSAGVILGDYLNQKKKEKEHEE